MNRMKFELLNAVCGVLIVICNTLMGATNGLLKRRNYLMLRHPQRKLSKEVKL